MQLLVGLTVAPGVAPGQTAGESEIIAGGAAQWDDAALHLSRLNLQKGEGGGGHPGEGGAARTDEKAFALFYERAVDMPENQNLYLHLPSHHLRSHQIGAM